MIGLNMFVRSTADVMGQPKVADRASDPIVELHSERGRYSRASAAVRQIPFGRLSNRMPYSPSVQAPAALAIETGSQ